MGGAGAARVRCDLHLSRRHQATGSPFRASGSSWTRGGGSGREAGGRLCTQVSGPCTPGCPPGQGQRGRGWDPVALLCSGRAGRGQGAQNPRKPQPGPSLLHSHPHPKPQFWPCCCSQLSRDGAGLAPGAQTPPHESFSHLVPVLKKVKHRLVENMSSGTADALGLSRAILCNGESPSPSPHLWS